MTMTECISCRHPLNCHDSMGCLMNKDKGVGHRCPCNWPHGAEPPDEPDYEFSEQTPEAQGVLTSAGPTNLEIHAAAAEVDAFAKIVRRDVDLMLFAMDRLVQLAKAPRGETK